MPVMYSAVHPLIKHREKRRERARIRFLKTAAMDSR